jgi:MinD superfamily P-loop ATPase
MAANGTARAHITLIIDESRCQVCDDCAAKRQCRINAIRTIDKGEPPFLDTSYCRGCMVCMRACPCGAVVRHEDGYAE